MCLLYAADLPLLMMRFVRRVHFTETNLGMCTAPHVSVDAMPLCSGARRSPHG